MQNIRFCNDDYFKNIYICARSNIKFSKRVRRVLCIASQVLLGTSLSRARFLYVRHQIRTWQPIYLLSGWGTLLWSDPPSVPTQFYNISVSDPTEQTESS